MNKRFFKDFFSFSQGERKGIIFLALLLLLLLIFPPVLRYCASSQKSDTDMAYLREQVAKLGEAAPPQYDQLAEGSSNEKKPKPQQQTFIFDPNTISHDSLMLLGFSVKQADAITKYRERGSGFRSAADFLKLNVITDKQRERLQPYISITAAPVKNPAFTRDTFSRAQSYSKQQAPVELNTADTALLRTLPGIGAHFAQKIVEYREALGGYVSTEQLLEIKNFGQERLQKLEGRVTIDLTKVQRFELSEENLDLMRRHPYVGAYAARGIAQYAKRKGSPATVEELSNNNLLTSLQAQQLKPYVR